MFAEDTKKITGNVKLRLKGQAHKPRAAGGHCMNTLQYSPS